VTLFSVWSSSCQGRGISSSRVSTALTVNPSR